MNFLEQLFPITKIFSVDFGERFTGYYILAILLYFIVSCFILLRNVSGIVKTLRTYSGELPISEFMADPILRDSWAEYEETFLDQEGERKKTEEEAIEFFNEQLILERVINVRYWMAVPGLLVGVGILGTFVGLTFGITSFDTTTTESIRNSIESLLDGMGTAFTTSIWGMFLSIVFNIIEKRSFKSVAKGCYSLSKKLDTTFKLSKAELLRFMREDQERALRNVFTIELDEQQIEPAYILRDLLYQSQEQTSSLKSFSTDLADGIVISTETINQMGNSLGTALHSSFALDFIPALKKFETAVEQLADVKEQSSGEFMERVVNNLETSIEKMLASVHNSLSGSTIASLEKLAGIVSDAGSSLNNLPEQVSNTMSNFQNDVGNINQSMQTTAKQISDEALNVTRIIHQEMNEAANSFSQLSQSVQLETTKVIEKQAEGALLIKKLVDKFKELLLNNLGYSESINGSVEKLNSSIDLMGELNAEMLHSAQLLLETSGLLQSNTEQFGHHFSSYFSENQKSIEQLHEALQRSHEVADKYVSDFEIIKQGLGSIFQQLEIGLSSYQTSTRDNLNDYLDQFSRVLEIAVGSLAGSIEDLEGLLESLSRRETKIAQ